MFEHPKSILRASIRASSNTSQIYIEHPEHPKPLGKVFHPFGHHRTTEEVRGRNRKGTGIWVLMMLGMLNCLYNNIFTRASSKKWMLRRCSHAHS